VISQIRIADEIIINKIDSNEVNVNDINQQIEALNPFAKINSASYCNIDLEGLLTDDEKVSRIYSGSESAFQFSERPEIESKVLRTNRRFNSKYISDLLNKVGSDVHRLKGYLRTEDNLNISIQFVFGKYSISELNNYSGPNLLVALGDKGAISPLFKSILSLAL
jgi:G3E family GTPase